LRTPVLRRIDDQDRFDDDVPYCEDSGRGSAYRNDVEAEKAQQNPDKHEALLSLTGFAIARPLFSSLFQLFM